MHLCKKCGGEGTVNAPQGKWSVLAPCPMCRFDDWDVWRQMVASRSQDLLQEKGTSHKKGRYTKKILLGLTPRLLEDLQRVMMSRGFRDRSDYVRDLIRRDIESHTAQIIPLPRPKVLKNKDS